MRLKRTWHYQTLKHLRLLACDADYRSRDRTARDEYRRFCAHNGGSGLRAQVQPHKAPRKTALVVGQAYLPFAKLEAVMIKAVQMAGFDVAVVGNRRYDFLRYAWLAGVKRVFELSDFDDQGDPAWVDRQIDRLRNLDDWLRLEYDGVHVGRFTIATALRSLKVGQLDFNDDAIRSLLRNSLGLSVRRTTGASRLLRSIKPECVLVLDRGYSGFGEIFDLALKEGIDTVMWNPGLGYKSNRLVVKRYHDGNEREHPLAPSAETWNRLCAMTWEPAYGKRVRDELFHCYNTQEWFSVVGTQFNKAILPHEEARKKLGLTREKKVAVIFPHILWDGSFFYGKDLFEDYTHWLIETLRAACSNSRLQWIVKLHPAHVVKAKQGNDRNAPAEVTVIEKALGRLPLHVKLIYPETELSTYSLFEIADYVVTVRGTVGIEAAVFGIPVVTAGTGRYAGRGFTLDSSTREEYLEKLARLENYPRLSREQIELAERFAYGTLFCRPLPLSSVTVEFERDGTATPKVITHCQTREHWLSAPDIRKLANWLADGKSEDITVTPEESTM